MNIGADWRSSEIPTIFSIPILFVIDPAAFSVMNVVTWALVPRMEQLVCDIPRTADLTSLLTEDIDRRTTFGSSHGK